jgi:glyoxylase-like metal-dependent hydrolase (beta-lactamase superfamily II)
LKREPADSGGLSAARRPRAAAPLASSSEQPPPPCPRLSPHRDDVADHAKWAKHFGAKRIIHEAEATAKQGTGGWGIRTGAGPAGAAASRTSTAPPAPSSQRARLGPSCHRSTAAHQPTPLPPPHPPPCPPPDQCEVKLSGAGPWAFPDGDADLTIIHTPGHTSDHCVLFSEKHKVGGR